MLDGLATVSPLVLAATVLVALHGALAMIDSLYVHLWRLRLHARPDSWREHLWHTVRTLLAAPIAWLVFVHPTAGRAWLVGLALVAIDQVVEMIDVVSERRSRAMLGGLSSFEYALHVALVTLRAGAVALAIAARPASAWTLDVRPIADHPSVVHSLIGGVVPGALAIAALHVWLAWRHRPRALAELAPA